MYATAQEKASGVNKLERLYDEFENKNLYTWCHTDISQPSYTTKQIYNNDLSCNGKSTVFLFTEDFLFYQTIK